MKLEDFADVSQVLGGGIFILCHRGAVVFVGKATSGTMLAKIANLRSTDRPKFLPKITFDQVFIRYVHPDKIESVRLELIAEFAPKHNNEVIFAASAQLERRI